MKREGKKRIVVTADRRTLRTGSVIAALVAALALFGAMLQLEKKQLAAYEKGEILVAAAAIPRGQMLNQENAADYFKVMELDQSCIPPTALTQIEQLDDCVAVADIEEGVLLTGGMFESRNEILAGMQDPVVAGCKAEDLYQVVGGVLRAGDRIHIYSVSEEGETNLIWQNIFVQQVFDSSGANIANADSTQAAQRINVYLEKQDVEQFYTELAQGSLRVVKVCDKQ